MRHAPDYHPVAFYIGLNVALAVVIATSFLLAT